MKLCNVGVMPKIIIYLIIFLFKLENEMKQICISIISITDLINRFVSIIKVFLMEYTKQKERCKGSLLIDENKIIKDIDIKYCWCNANFDLRIFD